MMLSDWMSAAVTEVYKIRPTAILTLLVACSLAYYASHIIFVLYFHPLAGIPTYGRWQHSTIWWSLYTALVTQDRVFRLDDAQRKSGKILRFSPDEVVINDLEILNSVMFARLDKLPGGAAFTTNRGTPNSFSAIGNAEAAGKRKNMMPQYANSSLDHWQPVFGEHIPALIRVIRSYGAENPVDILALGANALVDILGELLLNHKIHALDDYSRGIENPIARAISLWVKRGFMKASAPAWLWPFMLHFPGTRKWRDMMNSDGLLADFVKPLVYSARAKRFPERPALVHRLSTATDGHTRSRWPTEHVVSECTMHFFAGTETTSNTLAVALYLLSIDLKRLKKLHTELDEAIPDADTCIDLSTARTLPYLNAVLKETLRLYPGSPDAKMRIIQSGYMVDGHYLPPGTAVGISIWTTHRDRDVWGEDHDNYNPERWLRPQTEKQMRAFQPFSIGSRSCPGMNLAMNDLRILIAMIARNFDIRPAKETTPESMQLKVLEVIYPAGGATKLHFIPRTGV